MHFVSSIKKTGIEALEKDIFERFVAGEEN